MKRRIFLGFLTIDFILLFCVCSLASATVVGSDHDMYSEGKGTDPNVCSYCHIPHNAFGDKIWSDWGNEAQLTSGPSTTIGNMCYTCHDGTATSIGQTTAFNTSLQQHKISTGLDCDMCHTVHDNTNGKFMNITKKEDSYCAACHDSIINAGNFGDMTGVGNHPNYWTSMPNHDISGSPTGASCSVCHWDGGAWNNDGTCYLCHAKAHGAANYTVSGITNPILRNEDTDSQFCGTCHPPRVQSSTGGDRHPANTTGGSFGKLICHDCHDPHQPGVTDHPFILTDTNLDSQMCVNCHDGAQGPDIGNSHPYQVAFGSYTPTDASAATGTPTANVIDDDGENGPDYPLNSDNLVCETCHGTHRKVDDVGTKLLRITNTNSELCNNCHAAMY